MNIGQAMDAFIGTYLNTAGGAHPSHSVEVMGRDRLFDKGKRIPVKGRHVLYRLRHRPPLVGIS